MAETPPPRIGEIAALLAAEAAAGVLAARHLGVDRIVHVDDVVVRAGQPVADFDLGAASWQVELHLGRVDGASAPPSSVPVLPPVVAALPVGAIAGAGPVWAARLSEAGLATVGDAAIAADAVVADLVARHGVRARRLVGRARGCRVHLPPEPVLEGPVTVGRALGGAAPALPGAVIAVLDALAAAIDLSALAPVPLGDLWRP